MKKELQKKLSFVLFVMAVFFAGVALTAFYSSVLLVCIAGVLLLAATVYYVLLRDEKSQSPSEKTSELLLADRMAELMRGNEKAEKGVYIAVKKQHEAMEAGLAALEEKLGELIQSQDNAVKTVVLYNKENAKQMALSEREELGHLREALTQLQHEDKGAQGSVSSVVDAIKEMSHRLYEEYHENGEAMLSELETTVDSLEEIKELLKQMGETGVPRQEVVVPLPVTEPVMTTVQPEEEPVMEPESVEEPAKAADPNQMLSPEDIAALFAETETPAEEPEAEPAKAADPNQMLSPEDIAALFAETEAPAEEPAAESEPVEEPVKAADPNQMLSPDDIAALFAAAEAPAEEPVTEEKPEDALASSGVDLSNPNKTLSADDIAALVAALGN